MQRKVIWEENKRMIEDNNQRFFMGMRPFTMAMNKYGDLVRTSSRVHGINKLIISLERKSIDEKLITDDSKIVKTVDFQYESK